MSCNEPVTGTPCVIRRVFRVLTLRYPRGERGKSGQTRRIKQFIPPVVRGTVNRPSARTRAVIRHATARCQECEPTRHDYEPRINNVGLEGRSIASRPLN
jgi:hypothetical protein